MSASTATSNPFPGLRPFQKEEAHLFFGRKKQTEELLNVLRNTRLLSIVGASGSGKSSLVKCGLIPSLQKGAIQNAGENWKVALFTPGNAPFKNMAKALVPQLQPQVVEEEVSYQNSLAEAMLKRNSHGLVDFFQEKNTEKTSNLLLVIDQFEEVFRYRKQAANRTQSEKETAQFVELLLQTANQSTIPIYIVLTMRSDFLGECTLFDGLPEAINDGQYLVPRMTKLECKEAILGPIKVGGAAATPVFVEKLLEDVGSDTDQLPLLQHALMRTWTYWQTYERPEIPLDVKHYEAIGTMSKALSRHAEEAYSELRTEREQRICEVMFKGLTEKGIDNKGTRRPLNLGEICNLTKASAPEVTAVIDRFRSADRSFLMPVAGTPLQENTVIDVAHESLMRVWERLINWVNEEQQSAETYMRLAEAAALYQDSRSRLWRDPELQIALRWKEVNNPNEDWAKRYDPSFSRAMAFLDYSQKKHEFEIKEKERRQQLRLKRTRIIAIVVSIAAILALILATYAIFQRAEANKQRKLAENAQLRAEQNADEALKQKELADTERERAIDNEKEAIRQRKMAYEQRKEAFKQKEEAERQEREASRQRRIAEQQKIIADSLRLIAVGNEELAENQKDEAIKQREEAKKQREEALRQRKVALDNEKKANRLKNLALARNRALESIQIINDGSIDEGVEQAMGAFNLNKENTGPTQNDANYQALHSAIRATRSDALLYQDESSIKGIATHHSSDVLVIANEEGKVSILNCSNNRLTRQAGFRTKNELLKDVKFSKDNRYIATASYEGNFKIYDAQKVGDKGKALVVKSYNTRNLAIESLKDNTFLLHTDKEIMVVAPEKEAIKTMDVKAFRGVSAAETSADGKLVLVGNRKELYLIPVNPDFTFLPEEKITLTRNITALAITKDKKHVAVGFADGQIAILTLSKDLKVIKTEYELMHQTAVTGLDFYQHDSFLQLASASYDNTAKLLDVTNLNNDDNPQDKITLKGHSKWIYDIKYSRDGKYLYTIGEDKTLQMWYAKSEDMVKDLSKNQ